MTQPPNVPGQDPQWDPQHPGTEPSPHVDGQPVQPAMGPDGQPHTGPVGPDGQPYTGPVGPDGQPYTGPVGPDGQPYTGPVGPDGQPQPGYDPGMQAPPKENAFGIKKLLGALLVLAVLGVGAYFIWGDQQKSAALTVGNCLVWSGDNQEDLNVEQVDCADDTVYSEYVGEVLDGGGSCTDPNALPYSLGAEGVDPEEADKVGCVIPQLFEGKCYDITEAQDIVTASCDAAMLRVEKVVEESDATCDAGTDPVSYMLPARTYCVASQE